MMFGSDGKPREYDGYKIPSQCEDTPENREMRENEMGKCKEFSKELLKRPESSKE